MLMSMLVVVMLVVVVALLGHCPLMSRFLSFKKKNGRAGGVND
jgi:hypothetical protein